MITVRELGPQIATGLGFAGHTDVDFSLDVTEVPSRNEILSVSEHRRDGGLFVIRTLEDAVVAFERALNDIVRSRPPDEAHD